MYIYYLQALDWGHVFYSALKQEKKKNQKRSTAVQPLTCTKHTQQIV